MDFLREVLAWIGAAGTCNAPALFTTAAKRLPD